MKEEKIKKLKDQIAEIERLWERSMKIASRYSQRISKMRKRLEKLEKLTQ